MVVTSLSEDNRTQKRFPNKVAKTEGEVWFGIVPEHDGPSYFSLVETEARLSGHCYSVNSLAPAIEVPTILRVGSRGRDGV